MFSHKQRPSQGTSAMLGQSEAMVSLRRLVDRLAASASTALIVGESGTGKELVAQALHQGGIRSDGPFVPVNCGAIPKELIESELFGHRKGSFTGALSDRLGRFELAHGGTLFLDEIGDLPADMQVKLLRVLQERTVLPVGASKEVPVDVRVIAATHKSLEDEVKQGRFREDLYYRINVLPIKTTPLRERSDDVAVLIEHYAQQHAPAGAKPITLEAEFLGMLVGYGWPGNVRELSNLVDRLSTLLPGQTIGILSVPTCMLPEALACMQVEHLQTRHGLKEVPLSVLDQMSDEHSGSRKSRAPDEPCIAPSLDDDLSTLLSATAGEAQTWSLPRTAVAPVPSAAGEASNDEINEVEQAIFMAHGIQTLPPQGISLKQHLISIERSLIEQALAVNRGNVSKTAKLLQLQRTTLIEKINKYELRSNS
jgi:sigma-54 specific flagellar transcriptional regulator A